MCFVILHFLFLLFLATFLHMLPHIFGFSLDGFFPILKYYFDGYQLQVDSDRDKDRIVSQVLGKHRFAKVSLLFF